MAYFKQWNKLDGANFFCELTNALSNLFAGQRHQANSFRTRSTRFVLGLSLRSPFRRIPKTSRPNHLLNHRSHGITLIDAQTGTGGVASSSVDQGLAVVATPSRLVVHKIDATVSISITFRTIVGSRGCSIRTSIAIE